ncbi:uncharacterized serine-rich protein C215.13-like [Hibiscus syriacus]|uniref:uncharacterized serine-rich protein C215.13-like n=1 Tax=Hibiscus syriacus TaxID=106335 RepID=UPI001922AF86|nr:uncharacterized serine-rich protein C215.13-like [Hibiscus syriacus]
MSGSGTIKEQAGSQQVCAEAVVSQTPSKQASFTSSPSNEANTISPTNAKQAYQSQQSPSHVSKSSTSEIEPSAKNGTTAAPIREIKTKTNSRPSEVLERARAAIASADRATAAAGAAAELVNVKFGSLKLEGASS